MPHRCRQPRVIRFRRRSLADQHHIIPFGDPPFIKDDIILQPPPQLIPHHRPLGHLPAHNKSITVVIQTVLPVQQRKQLVAENLLVLKDAVKILFISQSDDSHDNRKKTASPA